MAEIGRIVTQAANLLVKICAAGAFLLAFGVASAFAIPSPELVVGSLSSISQLMAIGTALLGGATALVGLRAGIAGYERRSKLAIRIAVGLFIALLVAISLNVYQFTGKRAERLARLEETLLRPATTPGGPKLDPTNVELSYGEMAKQPRGITTQQAAELLEAASKGERDDLVFLDVRETAERETGLVPGTTFVRFPDFSSANLDLKGKKPVFICHNGNRSWETCQALAAQGIDCRFVVGGLEKWIVEKRPLTGLADRTLADLRAIPDYRNRDVLLDTPDVKRLVKEEGAVFVDVRYPAEFSAGHLTGAINLTIRTTPTTELPAKIAALPRRPIIVPCYDRRGCFFSEVFGLELTRAGHDFRGRYTLPWEYFIPRGRPPYVEKWQEQVTKSWWSKGVDLVAAGLSWLADRSGFVFAILVVAIMSRLPVLPLSVKAERDQIRGRAIEPELKELKAQLKGDPQRLARALRTLYRRNGMTPVRNLFAVLFLPVMALAVAAVHAVAQVRGQSFLWVNSLADRDPTFVLPALFAILIALYIDSAFVRSKRQRMLAWAVSVPLFTVSAALLSAAADIYIIASVILLLTQRAVITGQFALFWSHLRRMKLDRRVITLDEPALLTGHGNKAFRLAQLRAIQVPVPDGVVLPPHFLSDLNRADPGMRARLLDGIWSWLGAERVAVRSSAADEDGNQRSFAGVFESFLNVDRVQLEKTIRDVENSFASDRQQAYGVSAASGSVIVQHLIAAEYSGVLFTQDPAAGGLSLIELVKGTAEKLVSGAARPESFRFGRNSGQNIAAAEPPIDLAPLLALGRQAEQLFGAPQDIEWVYLAGGFKLVQSRDITSLFADESDHSLREKEIARLLSLATGTSTGEIAFAKNEMSELLPRPTPLSLSLMESIMADGGGVDLALRSLGLGWTTQPGKSYFTTVLGRLYVNKSEDKVRAIKIGPLGARRLRNADAIEMHFRQEFLPRFLDDVRVSEAMHFDELSTPDLFRALERHYLSFVHDTHREIDVINIAASFHLERAKKLLEAAGLNAFSYLGNIPETEETRVRLQAQNSSADDRRLILKSGIGHRAAFDYELSEPRYREDAARIDEMAAPEVPALHPSIDLSQLGGSVRTAVLLARRLEALKEDAKHHSLRELALLRRIVLAVDERLELRGLSFFLSFAELLALRDQPVDSWRDLAVERRQIRERFLQMTGLASSLTVRDLEQLSAGKAMVPHDGDAIRGTRVSGANMVSGPARVVDATIAERGGEISGFQDGDIIVAPMISPAWARYIARSGGLICEVGGWLSHTAILAREFGVTLIVGTTNVDGIRDGDLLQVQLNGTVEIVTEKADISAVA
ncbi:YidC/Oxa1 family membrane protein insertase [Bradyrhizobium sp. LjRoot220]|uniref:PEP/pyruvate-binding domain-containing protein n=1 Tax=Bradyrhizobium sp. LjRoot220 TaxID=3342284 RepID=UPI003ECE73AC